MTIYHQIADIQPGEFPAILAIGDSWFWYPRNNLLEALLRHPGLSHDYRNIFALGQSGARLQDYVGAGKFARDLRFHLSPNFKSGYAAFFISGAGNDAIDFSLALNEKCQEIMEPTACLAKAGLDDFLDRISTVLVGLIHQIRQAYKEDAATVRPIFLHGYDYLVPDGRGFTIAGKTFGGPWLAPKMDAAGVMNDIKFRTEVCRKFGDRLNDLMASFSDPKNAVFFIDNRGTLRSDQLHYQLDWDNEIHPTRLGFDKLIANCWITVLRNAGIAV